MRMILSLVAATFLAAAAPPKPTTTTDVAVISSPKSPVTQDTTVLCLDPVSNAPMSQVIPANYMNLVRSGSIDVASATKICASFNGAKLPPEPKAKTVPVMLVPHDSNVEDVRAP